jgi:V/A-type H+-transporting ATPase subunit B
MVSEAEMLQDETLVKDLQGIDEQIQTYIREKIQDAVDKKYIEFGKAFEERFVNQGRFENRTIEETLDLGKEILNILPKEELNKM